MLSYLLSPEKIFRGLKSIWWVIFFIIISYFLYQESLHKKEIEYTKVYEELLEQQTRYKHAVYEYEQLYAQALAQHSPEWLEQTLMRQLGLVPEGYQKVYFEDPIEN